MFCTKRSVFRILINEPYSYICRVHDVSIIQICIHIFDTFLVFNCLSEFTKLPRAQMKLLITLCTSAKQMVSGKIPLYLATILFNTFFIERKLPSHFVPSLFDESFYKQTKIAIRNNFEIYYMIYCDMRNQIMISHKCHRTYE